MKILVAGGSGLLGSNLLYALEKTGHEVFYTVSKNRVRFKGRKILVDLLKDFGKFEKYNPDLIVNTVGLTDVDRCEKEPNLSYQLNADLAGKLARYCSKKNCRLIHISTDQIFDGKAKKYTESSTPKPINVYGKTKLQGEKQIQNVMKNNYVILRTNFFGINCIDKLSLSEWVINSLRKNRTIDMFGDVYFNPLLVNTLVKLIKKCFDADIEGVYNCAADERVSKYQFGTLISRTFNLNSYIRQISVNEKGLLAKRPLNMYLVNKKLKSALTINSLSVKSQIIALHRLYQQNFSKKLKARHVKN